MCSLFTPGATCLPQTAGMSLQPYARSLLVLFPGWAGERNVDRADGVRCSVSQTGGYLVAGVVFSALLQTATSKYMETTGRKIPSTGNTFAELFIPHAEEGAGHVHLEWIFPRGL